MNRRKFIKTLGATWLAAVLESCGLKAKSPLPGSMPTAPAIASLSSATPTATPFMPAAATAQTTEIAAASPIAAWRASVAIGRVKTYDPGALRKALEPMLEGIGGLRQALRAGTRVGIKVNLTGGASTDTPSRPPSTELYVTHPAAAQVIGELLKDAGAGQLFILDGLGDETNFEKWGYADIAAPLGAKLIDLCKPDPYPDFARFPVQPSPFIYDSFLLNGILGELDLFISLAKLKVHSIGGVTLSLKNMLGIAPISKYRRYITEDNRSVFHESTVYDRRLPRVILDLCQARPVHLAFIDGVMTSEGGTGPWDEGLSQVKPGLLLAGVDPVATDAVATAVMGFNPEAADGALPFNRADNYLALADQIGIGTHKLEEIGVAGLSIQEAKFPFKPVEKVAG